MPYSEGTFQITNQWINGNGKKSFRYLTRPQFGDSSVNEFIMGASGEVSGEEVYYRERQFEIVPFWLGGEYFIIRVPKGNFLAAGFDTNSRNEILYAGQDREVTLAEIFRIHRYTEDGDLKE